MTLTRFISVLVYVSRWDIRATGGCFIAVGHTGAHALVPTATNLPILWGKLDYFLSLKSIEIVLIPDIDRAVRYRHLYDSLTS